MSILPIFVIIVSSLNDILDLATAYFPGINEVITFMFGTVVAMLVALEALQRRLRGEKGITKLVVKKLIALLVASLVESFPVLGVLPFQTIGAVVMGLIQSAPNPEKGTRSR